jgi:hypothetical protein
MLLPARQDLQNLISSKFISRSKHSNFENRTESAESRALERIEPFGEEWGALPFKSGTQIRNWAQLPASSRKEQAAAAKLAEQKGFELPVRSAAKRVHLRWRFSKKPGARLLLI